ncbi:MAG: hypothetical protein DMG58_12140 [Acidobacteria bacterium]|nr:MAG: hypothetical protein DMG58_12140 [Acidobacteriota bacterium]
MPSAAAAVALAWARPQPAERDGYPVIAALGGSRSGGGEDRAGENEQRQEKQKQLDVHGGVTPCKICFQEVVPVILVQPVSHWKLHKAVN